MKKIFSISLLALLSSLFAQATKIKIDVDRTNAWIDLKIYGMDELQTLPGYNCTKTFY